MNCLIVFDHFVKLALKGLAFQMLQFLLHQYLFLNVCSNRACHWDLRNVKTNGSLRKEHCSPCFGKHDSDNSDFRPC